MDVQKVDVKPKSLFESFNVQNTLKPVTNISATQQISKKTIPAQPTQDIFHSYTEKENSIWDTTLKYSGLASLTLLAATLIFRKPQKIDLSAIDGKFGTITESISKLTSNITENSKDIATLTENISKLSNNIGNNSKVIDGVQKTTNSILEKLTKLAEVIAAGGVGAIVVKTVEKTKEVFKERKNPPVSDTEAIWGGLRLSGHFAPDSRRELSPETIKAMKTEITRAVSGKSKVTPMDKKDVHMWSISYETQFNSAGGQRDIAEQAPVAYTQSGIDTYGIAPLFKARLNDNSDERTFIDLGNNRYIYRTQCYKNKQGPINIELSKVYDGKMANGAAIEVYEGVVAGQKYLFLADDNYYNYHDYVLRGGENKKDKKGNTVYENFENEGNFEKLRMAQFNNLVYEAISAAKEGKIKRADGTIIEAPNKMVAHEAWQSGGLLAKLRLYSIAEEEDNARPKEVTEYMRKLADNTAIPIHNIGINYQGRLYNDGGQQQWLMKCYFDTLFDKYSSDIINNAFIENVKDKDGNEIKLFGTVNQRVGFTGDITNPAAISVALAGKIGSVSEGYTEEITTKELAGPELQTLLKIKQDNGGLVSFPNGVDKNGLASTPEVIAGVNKDLGDKLKSILGDSADTIIRPYVQNFTDTKNEIDATKFKKDKIHNKKLFVALLKDAATHNTEPSPLIDGCKAPNFIGTFNVAGINENTTIFSMASRMDAQKGFDTAVEAYGELMGMIKKHNATSDKKIDVPVMIISGGKEGEGVDNDVAYLVKQVQDQYPDSRILWTRGRTSKSGLQLMNMTTTNTMPSDFEPYGISDLKGLYAGSHVLVTEVGGMRASGKISRKIYPAEFAKDKDGNPIYSKVTNSDTANAVTVKDYEYMCLYDRNDFANNNNKGRARVEQVRKSNAPKLAKQMFAEINMTPKDKIKLDLNALSLDVSWNKGAAQNYLDILKIK